MRVLRAAATIVPLSSSLYRLWPITALTPNTIKLVPPGDSDSGKPIRLSGVVTKTELLNPFSFLYVDAKDPATNSIVNYMFEIGHLPDLFQNGWQRDTVTAGMSVSVDGVLMNDKATRGNASTVTLPDGKVLKAAADYMLPPGRERSNNAWIKGIELPDGRKLPFSKDMP